MNYRVYVSGREIGAIGIFYLLRSFNVSAESVTQACEKARELPEFQALYDKYEHLQCRAGLPGQD